MEGFPGGASDKEPTRQCRRHKTWAWSLGQKDLLKEGMATHSGILAWKIPWTKESGRLQSIGLQSQTLLKWHSTHAQVLTKEGSVQLLSYVSLFATPWTAARQASLSITNCWSLLKHMSIESVMPSNHLILCCPLLLLPSVFPSIRVFSSESALPIR